VTGEPEAPLPLGKMPEPSREKLSCEACGVPIAYLRMTTPDGMPDFIHTLDDYAWIGWSWSAETETLSLVGTCSRACLVEWWRDRVVQGA